VETEARKKALHCFFDKVVGPLGFKFTPDVELRDFLLEQEVMLEAKHGIPFCPCQPLRHDRMRAGVGEREEIGRRRKVS